MKKTSKRALSLLLTLTLMFSAVMMFPSTASATVNETGTSPSFSMAVKNYNFWGDVSCTATSATVRSGYGVNAGLMADMTIYYTKSNGYSSKDGNSNSNYMTSVSAYKTIAGNITTVFGGHDISGDSSIARHQETRVKR